jgi:uncharacterized ion transporter superfamily protein YfcC
MLALSYSLGWDSFVGLGMSILAVNMGFSAAITNPFTIGVAQRLAGLPLFSGAWYRLIIFAVFFVLYIAFMIRYARKIERNPLSSSVYHEDQAGRERYSHLLQESDHIGADLGKAIPIFLTFLALILVVLVAAPFIAGLSDYSMPIVGLLFLIGAFSAALVSSAPAGTVRKAALEGLIGIAPAIPLILMAVSVKHIVMQGGILDTILNMAAQPFSRLGPSSAALLIFVIALLIEFFIASGSAKAFLLMPILVPLADLVGVTRQVTVTAYCFGDGFSNMAYPTNPVLLISLMLCAVSFPKWLRWSLGLWVWVLLAALFFLSLGVVFNYGPF